MAKSEVPMADGETRDVLFQPVKSATSALAQPGFGVLAARPQVRGTVYLLLDHSASMGDRGKMDELIQGSLRLFIGARERAYLVGAIGFANRANLLVQASCDLARFSSRLATLEPTGRTAMAQAISLGTRRLRRRRGDKLILLITDGLPDNREATVAAARLARAQGITLIAIGTGGADEAFLATLTPKPELAVKVEPKRLAQTIHDVAKTLP